ncbi:transcriptional regulator with XRE-family HTH domain [Nocardiopsis mwathae]|uniref:Transcriptional regulator with XRE-family HTH domain n=1 Tax=Nocardiopsis mwathae TaxID=1472723 RepID=A0A7W9YGK7_9ACTN|nr:helix-turn-helix transcriptional regulator [Nocardiopsis mwathae]MBB6171742.1 transcriptional regulator with XRE-family HTH domain [Nocardiopsis mwathae]
MAVGRPKRVTLRGRWLGQRLRELRDENRMKVDEVGDYLQRSSGTISRFESGLYPIRRAEVVALLDLYCVNDAKQRENLLRIADDVWQTGWWDGYAGDVSGWLVDFVWLESLATEHRLFEPCALPGLLQTEQYARALMMADDPSASKEQFDRWIELRMERQRLLDRDTPPCLDVVVDEAVLRRRVGGSRIMRAQLRHVLDVMDHPAVTFRVLPFSIGAHAGAVGSFNIFEMAEPYSEVAYVETVKGGLYIESPDTRPIVDRYDRLREASLDCEASAELISALIKELS